MRKRKQKASNRSAKHDFARRTRMDSASACGKKTCDHVMLSDSEASGICGQILRYAQDDKPLRPQFLR